MLPSDPVMLMSVINTKLRDFYPSLERLCEDMDISEKELKERLLTAGFEYDPIQNRFKGFSINRDTSKASSIGSVRCKASDRSNTCCLTRSDNEADDRTNRGFAVKEVYRGSLK